MGKSLRRAFILDSRDGLGLGSKLEKASVGLARGALREAKIHMNIEVPPFPIVSFLGSVSI